MHRDIKPSNILIDTTGKAKLVDFGLANSETTQSITITGELFGTPNYMPPEQIQYPDKVDKRSDIYSLGATMHHIVTGKDPCSSGKLFCLKEIRAIKPELSEEMEHIIRKATAMEKEERYQTAAEMKEDLCNYSKTSK